MTSSRKRKYKVVMTDYDFDSLEEIETALNEVDAELISAQCKTENEVIELARDADGIINEYFDPLSRRVIESLERCKVIARTGIGVDTIDVKAATEKGIYVVNVPQYCLDEVSDHAIALLLALARRLIPLSDSVKRGIWDWKIARPIHKLRGKLLGIVGFGKIARELVLKAQGFGLVLACYDPYIDPAIPRAYGVDPVPFEELLDRSDFVSIHVPLNSETRGMFGEEVFKRMKNTAYVINTARGPVIKREALYRALVEGWIAGAGLDVLENEPPDEDDPLLELDNVIITPHLAWYSEDSLVQLKTSVGREVARALKGERPLSLVNPEVLRNARGAQESPV